MQDPTPTPAPMADLGANVQRDIRRAVEADRPIDDLVGWLIAKYPEADQKWIFAALKVIYESGFQIAPASEEHKTYRIGPGELRAYPQRVE